MQNADSKMQNDQCGTILIGHFEKSRDSTNSAIYYDAAQHCCSSINCGMQKMTVKPSKQKEKYCMYVNVFPFPIL